MWGRGWSNSARNARRHRRDRSRPQPRARRDARTVHIGALDLPENDADADGGLGIIRERGAHVLLVHERRAPARVQGQHVVAPVVEVAEGGRALARGTGRLGLAERKHLGKHGGGHRLHLRQRARSRAEVRAGARQQAAAGGQRRALVRTDRATRSAPPRPAACARPPAGTRCTHLRASAPAASATRRSILSVGRGWYCVNICTPSVPSAYLSRRMALQRVARRVRAAEPLSEEEISDLQDILNAPGSALAEDDDFAQLALALAESPDSVRTGDRAVAFLAQRPRAPRWWSHAYAHRESPGP